MFVLGIVLILITSFYIWLKWNYSYWKRLQVLGPKPTLLVGNVGPTFTFSEHWGILVDKWYRDYSNEPYVGYYKLWNPAILARDADLVKDVMITNFNIFRENGVKASKKYDPLLAANPFFALDEEWKTLRKQLTPSFSPSKLKTISPMMTGVGDEFIKFIKSYTSDHDFEAKHLSMRFITQNVMKCAFSIDADSFNKDHDSEFLLLLKEIFDPSLLVGLKFLAWPHLSQTVADLLPFPFITKSTDRAIRHLIETNKAARSGNIQSQDFFQTMLEIQRKFNFDDTLLAGHAVSLFTEGTETSNTTMSYALYELAKNPECQRKLYDEISKVLSKYDGQITFDAIQEMPYLDEVVLETLRIHPPVLTMSKVCTENYTLPKTNGQSEPVTIRPGTFVQIPIYSIHMDPKHYPNPEEFRPERFNEEEQRKRHKGTYLAFGEGPRICPGMRFGMLQVKYALVRAVQSFNIKLSPNHKPIVLDTQSFLSVPKDGILVRFECR
ncbi:probable cytochrome P450 6a13 [Contarinia nasturtii]|uniref:probable cytochrome P450 6a13 n=1 Tax=Contarinia nasturtii TaxID=265458 RepID=UPI0012D43F9E|nr:probable cytochrome P450 6a13 [Contarinia nasturtii]